jgi:hypothetical protein
MKMTATPYIAKHAIRGNTSSAFTLVELLMLREQTLITLVPTANLDHSTEDTQSIINKIDKAR